MRRLRELGFTIPLGARHVMVQALALLEQTPESLRPLLTEACEEIREFERRIAVVEKQLRALAVQLPVVNPSPGWACSLPRPWWPW